MSSEWQRNLRQTLYPPDGRLSRLTVMGIGQSLYGDDGAGPAAARRLAALPPDPSLQIIDAGHAPENCLGPVVAFRPDLILLIDAARWGGAPGEIVWLPAETCDDVGGSSHTLSLAMLGGYLRRETGAAVYVLGIAPGSTGFDEGLSAEVKAAVKRVAGEIVYWRNAAAASSAMSAGEVSVVND